MITRFLTLAFTSVSFFAVALAAEVKTGQPAPEFTLTDIQGNGRSLSDFKGQWVVLEWFNNGCPFVQKFYNAGEMQRLQEKLTGDGVVWLTINSTAPRHSDYNDPAASQKLVNDWKMKPTAFLLDPEGKVGRKYKAQTTPHMYVINPEGVLIYQGAIDDVRSTDVADLERANNYVLAALKAGKAGKTPEHTDTRPYGCGVKY